MDELIKTELLSLICNIRECLNDLEPSYESKFQYELEGETLVFDVWVKVEWETCNCRDYGDVYDFEFTGGISDWSLECAIAMDEDGNEIEVSEEIINLFNEKI